MKKLLILLFIFIGICFPAQAQNERVEFASLSFWENFNDTNLLDNISKVYENNHDLKSITLKVKEAQRIVKLSFANELPHLSFDGYVGRIFKSSDEVFGNLVIPDYTETHYYLPITMNYEVDLWGKNRLRTKSKKKQYEMTLQDKRSAYIYISSAFAVYYFNLIRCDKLIDYQEQLLKLQEEIIKSYKFRYECGTATLSDIEKAEKNLTFIKEDLNKLSEKRELLKNQIAVLLTDRGFEDIKRSKFDELDNFNIETPESIDFSIISNRPDRIKSELDLERIGIDVKVAKREMLPKFIITGSLGFNLYNISSSHNFLADIGVVPVWDLFTGGRKIQMLKIKKVEYDIAVQRYEKVILTSIQETNDALYSMKTAEQINNTISDRVNSDIKELNYVQIKNDAGISDNLDMLMQQEAVINSQKQLVNSKINKIISSINLYQALGGVDFIKTNRL